MKIRQLHAADARTYQSLRLLALRESPAAFSASYEDEVERSVEEVAARLAPAADGSVRTLGIFEDDELRGFVAVVHPQRKTLRHSVELAGIYVAPAARRRGLGGALLQAAIAHAWSLDEVRRIKLGVNEANAAARALYRSAGFEHVGVEPDELNIEGRLYDVERYALTRDGGTR
ncbi:MAG: GNAT family protein [Arenicellales bacterium]